MKSALRLFLIEAIAQAPGKNTHMTHIEDSVIYGGVIGASKAIAQLRNTADLLSGNAKKHFDISVKWDGAPALICGIDPTDGQFFVAKKSVFNKNPIVYKSVEEIKKDLEGDLATKMIIAFQELKGIGITGVIQGDILFTAESIKEEEVDSEKYYIFHPNTIAYAVPVNSDEGRKLKKAKLGIVFHTSYSGDSFESMKASYGVDISKFKKTDSVWMVDAMVRDLSGTATLTSDERKIVLAEITKAEKILDELSHSLLNDISANRDMAITLETFYNSLIRSGSDIVDSEKRVNDLIEWLSKRFDKEAEALKTEKGKAAKNAQKKSTIEFFSGKNKDDVKKIFDLQNSIVRAKLILLSHLNKIDSIKTFIKTAAGYRVTSKEGVVAIDHLSNSALKLVDRLEFSRANFSPDTVKGFVKKNR